MSDVEERIREVVANLLKAGQVEYVIGYERGSTSSRTRPCFITDHDDASRLVWNEYCTSSLPKYLIGCEDKVGILVKGCDGRAIVELIKEKQVDRGRVVVISPPCPGMMRARGPDDEEHLAPYCERCPSRTSPLADIRIESKDTEVSTAAQVRAKRERKPWLETFQDCIECMACIRSCPLCYCEKCELDGSLPSLVSKLRVPGELQTFHLVKAMHMAGRCVGCGACEAACPVGIPLTELYSRANDRVKELLGYVPGIDIESTPPVELPQREVDRG